MSSALPSPVSSTATGINTMLDDLRLPDLTLPAIPVGDEETPHDLKRLLYKGGASCRVNQVELALQQGSLGDVQQDRVELVRLIRDFIHGNVVGGGSAETARTQMEQLIYFFNWSDKVDAALNLSEVLKSYLHWTEHLLQRVEVVRDLKQRTACHQARLVGQILDGALERLSPIFRSARIKVPSNRKTAQGTKADKQNLHDTFTFGHLLQDICDGTPLTVIMGSRLVRIPLRQGGTIEIKAYGPDPLPENMRKPGNVRRTSRLVLAYETSRSLEHRFRKDIVNLRMQAELLMFVGQTGMNLTQAQNLQLCRFSYSSDIDGYKVREYKPRRKGEVLFEIFSEYRSHFERYLAWRRELFPDTEKRLFPFIRSRGAREDRRIKFGSVQVTCKKAGVVWMTPSILRGTRVNWLLRRSGDPTITAEMAQHHKRTLLNVYETPSLQLAVTEITRFHQHNDPALTSKAILLSVAPGECDGSPSPVTSKPESVLAPDCTHPSGCLWCEHHRDIDSFDYVWSLACFRHIKILELSKQPPSGRKNKIIHPAEHVIRQLGAKLSWFRESNAKRREWVEESLARVDEGYYHSQWSYLIETVELTSI
jgi:hypothetical protein